MFQETSIKGINICILYILLGGIIEMAGGGALKMKVPHSEKNIDANQCLCPKPGIANANYASCRHNQITG